MDVHLVTKRLMNLDKALAFSVTEVLPAGLATLSPPGCIGRVTGRCLETSNEFTTLELTDPRASSGLPNQEHLLHYINRLIITTTSILSLSILHTSRFTAAPLSYRFLIDSVRHGGPLLVLSHNLLAQVCNKTTQTN